MTRFKYAFRKCLELDKKELGLFFYTSLMSGFILSFRKWGTAEFNASDGFTNLILFTFIFLFLYYVFVVSQKFVASYKGYECKYELWPYGPLLGLFITFMTFGFVPFLYLGNVHLKEIPSLRLGKFRQSVNMGDLRTVGVMGPFAVLLVMLILLQPLFLTTGFEIYRNAVIVGAAIIFFSSLPLPKTNGINVILHSRLGWLAYFLGGILLLVLILDFAIATYIIAAILVILMLWLILKLIKGRKH